MLLLQIIAAHSFYIMNHPSNNITGLHCAMYSEHVVMIRLVSIRLQCAMYRYDVFIVHVIVTFHFFSGCAVVG